MHIIAGYFGFRLMYNGYVPEKIRTVGPNKFKMI
jgi:hypothetical protein